MADTEKIRQFAQNVLGLAAKAAPHKPITTKADLVLSLVHARCIKAGRAGLLLCDHGYGEDAVGVGRTLYEATRTFTVLSRDESRMPFYVCWGDFELLRRAEKIPGWLPPETVKELQASVAEFAKMGVGFNEKARHWFPGGVFGLAEHIDKAVGIKADAPGSQQSQYQSWYSVASSFSHAGSISTLWLTPKTDGTLAVSPNPSGRWVDLAMGLVGKDLCYLADVSSERWHAGSLQSEIEANLKLWAEATDQA